MGPWDMFGCVYQIGLPKSVRLASWGTESWFGMKLEMLDL